MDAIIQRGKRRSGFRFLSCIDFASAQLVGKDQKREGDWREGPGTNSSLWGAFLQEEGGEDTELISVRMKGRKVQQFMCCDIFFSELRTVVICKKRMVKIKLST